MAGAQTPADVRTALGLGTAAQLDVGTTANKVVQLDGTAKLPAVDGSQLTGIVASVVDVTGATGTLPVDHGGTGATTAATARANLGSTTVGDAVFIAANAAAARTAIGTVIGTDVQAYAATASQVEMEGGTETAIRAMSPLLVAQAIAALSTSSASTVNRIINGGFSINQRLATSVADDTYCLDRWYVLTETGNVTVSQQTDQENGTPYNIRLTQPDASPKRIGLAQIIEARDCKDLRGKVAALGLRIRNSTGGQINYAILEWSGTADSVTSDVISAWAASPTYIGSITERVKGTVTPAANTWTDATAITGTINAATNNLIVFIWTNGTFVQNATLDIGRVQLEEGSSTAFKSRLFEQELSLCQRFFEKSWDLATAIGATTGDGAEAIRQTTSSEDKTMFNASFRVRKRAIPVVTWYNPNTGSSGQIYDIGASASRTVTGTYSNTPTSETKLGAPTHAAAGTGGNIIWAQWTASAEL